MNNPKSSNKIFLGKTKKNVTKATPPPKSNYSSKNDNTENKGKNKGKKFIKSKFIKNSNNILNKNNNLFSEIRKGSKKKMKKFIKKNVDSMNSILKNGNSGDVLKLDQNNTILVSNNFSPTINIKTPIINIKKFKRIKYKIY